jgi:glyceraldehyde-3-phosphate dehydrogenase/erythrose-4-phosphate dehydrogenase
MPTRIGINGFGRMGRLALRAGWGRPNLQFVHINEVAGGPNTTIHDMTNTQVVVDAPHKDLRRARASSLSLIPTSTGSATAIGLIYPELLGKLTGIAVRVPLLNASLTDCVFEVQRPTTVDEVNAAFKRAAEGPLEGILDTKSARWFQSTTRTTPGPQSWTRPQRWSWTARA